MPPETTNTLGQPIGHPVEWTGAATPDMPTLTGRFATLTQLDPNTHAHALFTAYAKDTDARNWTYLAYGPFTDLDEFTEWLENVSSKDDPRFYCVIDNDSGKAVGVASYLRIKPTDGSIEVGHIHFSPLCQRSPMSTEAMYLMMRQVFEQWGYRRYEWKCDALNAPSQTAAKRLGFEFEGIFRQATTYKNRNRDTAWFAILDHQWPTQKKAFESWLKPSNFDHEGRQLKSLRSLI